MATKPKSKRQQQLVGLLLAPGLLTAAPLLDTLLAVV